MKRMLPNIKNISKRRLFVLLGLILLVIGGGFIAYKALQEQQAASGGGTASVTPQVVPASATGETLSFNYTADSTKDSGSLGLEVPIGVGWSTPQSSLGTAGYTTASSTGGVLGDIENSIDNPVPNWHNTTHQALSLTAGTGPLIGLQQLTNDITQYMGAGETWYYNNLGAQNWGQTNTGADLRIGVFMTSSAATAAGDLKWQDDNNTDLASPEHMVGIPALAPATNTYFSATLTGTGGADVTNRNSYGYQYATDIGATQVKSTMQSPLFDPAESATNWTGTPLKVTVGTNLGGKEGIGSLHCSFSALTGSGDGCYRTGTAFTVGPGTTVGFWIKPSIALSNGDLEWVDSANSGLNFPSDIVPVSHSGGFSAGTWTFVTLSTANFSNLSTASYGIRLTTAKGAFTLDIDAMGKVINQSSSLTNWNTNVADAFTLTADAANKKEGTNSLSANIDAAATAGEFWYRDVAAEDWSAYTKAGFWIRSSVATGAGDIQFVYDDNTGLTSPLAAINIGALAANTWSWQILPLSGTLSTINSYGFKYNVDIGAVTVNADYILLGPGSPLFSGNTITVNFLDLKAADTVNIVYGAGGGASGTNVPTVAGTHTFTVKNRDDSSGTLTALISGSPVVTVNTRPTVSSFSDAPDPLVYGNDITFDATWADDNAAETAKLLVCKTNNVLTTGGCPGGSWYAATSYSGATPLSGIYTTQFADIATSPNNYYLFVCDVKAISNSCSLVSSGAFTVQDIILTFSLSSNSIDFGSLNSAGSRYANPSGGSNTEVEAHTFSAGSNAGKGYTVSFEGATLTSGANTITPIGPLAAAPNYGNEQFGLRAQVTSGAGSVVAPYDGSGFAFGATSTTFDQIASGSFGDAGITVYSLRYLANIQKSTNIGQYSTVLTFIMTASI